MTLVTADDFLSSFGGLFPWILWHMSNGQYVTSVQARKQYLTWYQRRFPQKAALNRANVAESADDAAPVVVASRQRRL
jgi:hypothetical protein